MSHSSPTVMLAAVLLFAASTLAADEAEYGPLIAEYGPVYSTDTVDFPTPTDHQYKAVFDISKTADSPGDVNQRINTVARYLNMHAQSGVPAENMSLAMVLHGPAARDVLSNQAFNKRFGTDNPNLELISELQDAGVQVVLCSQSAAYNGFQNNELADGVKKSLSAMTALTLLQSQGYALIAF